jgi:hypothetical protein
VVLLVKDKLHEFDNYFQCAQPTGVEQSDRFSSDGELYHLAGAFLSNGWKKGYVVKEEDVRWIFNELALHFHSVFGSRARDALWVFLLFYYFPEVTFNVALPTGRSGLLSPSDPIRSNTGTIHEAIFMFLLIDWCTLWLKFSQKEMKVTDFACFFRLRVRRDLGGGFLQNRLLSWHCTSQIPVG